MFSLRLFKKCCSKEWQFIFEANKKNVLVPKSQRVFNEGEPVKGIYFIEKGKVKVLSKNLNNEEKIIRLCGDGEILGHRALNSKYYPISAETLCDSKLSFIPIEIFNNILKANPEFSFFLINFMSDELRDTELRMKNMQILDPKIRVAQILEKLIDIFGYDKKLPGKLNYMMQRRDIANMAGTTYETVIRSLALFDKLEIVKIVKKELVILNESRLRNIANGTEIVQ